MVLYISILIALILVLLPISVLVLDILIALNLLFAFIILSIVIRCKKATDFSLFPIFLLMFTLFNLATNISAARLILTKGAAFDGKLIHFASLFITGTGEATHLITGFAFFILFLALQFMLIRKGTARVTEVAARFFLDIMPGKQMAIDSELNNGGIEEKDNARKIALSQEENFYGSLDGAMRFLSGSEKFRIFIIVFTILAGILISTKLQGETIINAAKIYIPFAVGNGILSMLPVLLVFTAVAIVVNRISSAGDFGVQIGKLFPFYSWKRDAGLNGDKIVNSSDPPDQLSLELGFGLIPLVDKEKGAELLERIQGMRRQIALDMGIVIPKIRIIDNVLLDSSEYCIKICGVIMEKANLRMGHYLCINPGTIKEEIVGEKTKDPAFGLPALWITEDKKDEAKRAGYTVADHPSIITTHLTDIIMHHAAELLGRQETQNLIDSISKDYSALVKEAIADNNGATLGNIRKVLQGLLKEQVSIKNIPSILEVIADFDIKTTEIWFLIEKVRQALSNQICFQYADEQRILHVLTLEPSLGQMIFDSKAKDDSGEIISVMEPKLHDIWVQTVKKYIKTVKDQGYSPVILCSVQARHLIKKSLDRELPEVAVLSVAEIVSGYKIESVGVIALEKDGNLCSE